MSDTPPRRPWRWADYGRWKRADVVSVALTLSLLLLVGLTMPPFRLPAVIFAVQLFFGMVVHGIVARRRGLSASWLAPPRPRWALLAALLFCAVVALLTIGTALTLGAWGIGLWLGVLLVVGSFLAIRFRATLESWAKAAMDREEPPLDPEHTERLEEVFE